MQGFTCSSTGRQTEAAPELARQLLDPFAAQSVPQSSMLSGIRLALEWTGHVRNSFIWLMVEVRRPLQKGKFSDIFEYLNLYRSPDQDVGSDAFNRGGRTYAGNLVKIFNKCSNPLIGQPCIQFTAGIWLLRFGNKDSKIARLAQPGRGPALPRPGRLGRGAGRVARVC